MFDVLSKFISSDFYIGYNESVSILDDEGVMNMHKIFVGVVALYIPIIIITNTLVFWGILLYPGFYTSNNIILTSLAMADFLLGTFCLPSYILCYSRATRDYISNNKYACLIRLSSITITVGGSISSLLLITVDRYLAILYPLKYAKWISVERTIKIIIAMWLLLIFIGLLPIIGYNNYSKDTKDTYKRCNYYFTVPRPYLIGVNIIGSQGCIGLAAVLNAHIIIAVRQQIVWFRKNKCGWLQEQSRHFELRVRRVKITITLMILFIILWLPYLIIAPFKLQCSLSAPNIEIANCIALLICFANSLINAPIYAILRSEYRAVYKRMLTTAPWRWRTELRNMFRMKHSYFFREHRIIRKKRSNGPFYHILIMENNKKFVLAPKL